MKKTIVEIHYRGYVPRDWIALKICSIAFSGENSLKFNDDCRKIEFSEYYIYNPQCEELEKQIIKQKELIKDTKKWYNLFEIKEEKELVIMQEKLRELDKKRWKKESDLYWEYKNYLDENGFYLINSGRGGGELGYDKELYEKVY